MGCAGPRWHAPCSKLDRWQDTLIWGSVGGAGANAAGSAFWDEDVKWVVSSRPLDGVILKGRGGTGGALEKSSQLSEDVERLNHMLRRGLRFEIRRPPPRLASSSGDGLEFLIGALYSESTIGRPASAVTLLITAETGRDRRLILARCLADCAMALGLGTSVF